MGEWRIGIVMVKEQMSFAQRHLSATTESLKALGCAESDIKIISSPTVLNVPLTTQFFAEYTEVDAVIVLVEPSQSREYETMLYGITRLQRLGGSTQMTLCKRHLLLNHHYANPQLTHGVTSDYRIIF